jgi:vacuolar-type H+-ATPase subunit H
MQTQAIDATRAETAQEEAEQARDDAGAFAEQTALDRTATGADRTATGEDRAAVNTALSGFAESTLPNAIQAVGDKADAEITRVGQAGDAQVSAVETAGAEQIAAATEQADRAESEADKSTTQATKSESYAVGGTGTRPGEDTDNSKHYSEVALNNILNGVTAHNENADAHQSIQDDLRNVEAIARGRATAHVFDTYEDMAYWLSVPENVAELVMGDNLYIRDTAVKDYWWDGTQISELEAEAPDLTDYYTKSQVDAMLPIQISRTDYDALVAAGTIEAGRSYDVREVT